MTTSSPRRPLGFSLVEVLVALGLLAFGLALVFATLRGATGATSRAEADAQRNEILRAAQGLLRTNLGQAMALPFELDPDSGQAIYFRGTPDSIEFVAPMPGYLSFGGPYLQKFEIVAGASGRARLQFSFRMLTPDGPLPAQREPQVLLDGIASGGFEFRTIDQDSRPAAWQSRWQRSAQLPPLVRLRLTLGDGGGDWPDLVIRLRAGVPFTAPPEAAGGGP